MKRFKDNRHLRLSHNDYSMDGYYFVTFNTLWREPFLGEIRNGIMGLSEIGCMAAKFWQEVPQHFKRVTLDEWVITPDHMHGIIGIGMENAQIIRNPCGAFPWEGPTGMEGWKKVQYNQFGKTIPQSLSSILNQFKGSVKRWCNKNGHAEFAWQFRFFDEIIRNKKMLDRIRKYIKENPSKWQKKLNLPQKE